MLYQVYDLYQKSLLMQNKYSQSLTSLIPEEIKPNFMKANEVLLDRMSKNYSKQPWKTNINGRIIKPEVIVDLDFCNLVEFNNKKNSNILLIAPMSGHYATLLQPTINELIKNYNVFVTDWKNPRDVSLKKGLFSLTTYIEYLLDFMKIMQNYSMIAVCQPTIPASIACAYASKEKLDILPKSLVLMGGPMKLDESNETEVSELGVKKTFEWFNDNLIYKVPKGYKGEGRQVYPAFLQLNAFIQMNLGNHIEKHLNLYNTILNTGIGDEKTELFYDEYLSVMDMDASFYLETIDLVFQRRVLTSEDGFPYKNHKYHLSDIDPKINILSIEGELDDIAKPGQTSDALKYFHSKAHKEYKIFSGVGHYGIFSGSKWRNEICPFITQFIDN